MQLNRRRLIAGTASLVGGGSIVAYLASDPVRAQVEMDTLAVPDASTEDSDGLVRPWCRITGAWQYTIDAQPAEWRVYLLLGAKDSDSASALDMADGSTTTVEGSGSYEVVGDLTAPGSWSAEDFAPAASGESKTTTVDLGVLFEVRNASRGILADALATRAVEVTVTQTGAAVSVGGEGSIAFQHDDTESAPFA